MKKQKNKGSSLVSEATELPQAQPQTETVRLSSGRNFDDQIAWLRKYATCTSDMAFQYWYPSQNTENAASGQQVNLPISKGA